MNRSIPRPLASRSLPILAWVALLLLAAALRLFRLDLQPLWWDEGFSLYFATESTPRLVELTSLDIHPPLYYLLLQGWLAVTGLGAIQARLLSVLISLISLPLAARVAGRLVAPRYAWPTAFLLAISPFHIYYAQEVRMYGLMTLLALLATWYLLERHWAWLGVTIAAGLYTQYYFALFAGALLIVSLLRDGGEVRRGVFRAMAGAGAAFVPWLLYAGPRLVTYVDRKLVIESDAPMTPLEFLPRHLVAWGMGHLPQGWQSLGWGALLLILLVIAGWGAIGREARRDLAILIGVPTTGIFVVGLFLPFVDPRIERQLLMILPFLLMLAAAGIERIWAGSRGRGLAAAVGAVLLAGLSLAGFYTVPRYPGEDYRPLLARVSAEQAPGDGWLAIYEWQIGYLRAYLPDRHPTPAIVPLGWAEEPGARRAGSRALLDDYPRLWLPAYQVKGRALEEELASALGAEGVPAWNDWYGNTRLYLFGQAPPVPPLRGGGTIAGAGVISTALGREQVESGQGIIPLFILLDAPQEGWRISAQLIGRGAVWGEWDGPVTRDVMRGGLPVALGTPPGSYGVGVTVYDASSGAVLDRTVDGRPDGTVTDAGTVQVTRPPAAIPPESAERLLTISSGATLGPEIRLLGAAVPEGAVRQGDQSAITLFWQALAPLATDEVVFLQLLDTEGQVVAAHESSPVNGTFPTPDWQPGDLIRDPHTLTLPADLPAGRYALITGIYDPATGRRRATSSGVDALPLGWVESLARERIVIRPEIGVPLDGAPGIPFGGRARLVEVDLPEERAAGQEVEVLLLWQATATGGPPLRSFVQFQGPEGIVTSDHPTDPPATAWIDGEWIVDSHRLVIPSCADRLVAGLYQSGSGVRLQTPAGDTALLAPWNCAQP